MGWCKYVAIFCRRSRRSTATARSSLSSAARVASSPTLTLIDSGQHLGWFTGTSSIAYTVDSVETSVCNEEEQEAIVLFIVVLSKVFEGSGSAWELHSSIHPDLDSDSKRQLIFPDN